MPDQDFSPDAGWAEAGKLWAFVKSKGLMAEAAEFMRRLAAAEERGRRGK